MSKIKQVQLVHDVLANRYRFKVNEKSVLLQVMSTSILRKYSTINWVLTYSLNINRFDTPTASFEV